MQVIIQVVQIGGSFGSEPGKCQVQIRWFMDGRQLFGSGTAQITMGLDLAGTTAAIIDAARALSLDLNDPIPPDAVITVWGGPTS